MSSLHCAIVTPHWWECTFQTFPCEKTSCGLADKASSLLLLDKASSLLLLLKLTGPCCFGGEQLAWAEPSNVRHINGKGTLH
mmetsp:Transcript_85690/g.227683  ORF Transcript_85690/g.227683 Transcript_85690/m.227683 type:complete len:82 (+) Transcript_85690:2004-2249(+)